MSYYLQIFIAEAWKKHGRKWQNMLSRETRNAYIILIIFLIDSFEGLRDCNANLKFKVDLVYDLNTRTCKWSRHTAVLTD